MKYLWFLIGAFFLYHHPMDQAEFSWFLIITFFGYLLGAFIKGFLKAMIAEAKKDL